MHAHTHNTPTHSAQYTTNTANTHRKITRTNTWAIKPGCKPPTYVYRQTSTFVHTRKALSDPRNHQRTCKRTESGVQWSSFPAWSPWWWAPAPQKQKQKKHQDEVQMNIKKCQMVNQNRNESLLHSPFSIHPFIVIKAISIHCVCIQYAHRLITHVYG